METRKQIASSPIEALPADDAVRARFEALVKHLEQIDGKYICSSGGENTFIDEGFFVLDDHAQTLKDVLAALTRTADDRTGAPDANCYTLPNGDCVGKDCMHTPSPTLGEALALTSSEAFLLDWLSKEDFSQYGECHGKDLDSLVAKGLAQLHDDGGEKGSFIAKGKGQMFNSVSLTEKGRARAASAKGEG